MTKMKGAIIMTVLLFALIGQAAAASTTVSVNDTIGAKGKTAEVLLNIEGASALGSMDIVLKYDPSVLSAMTVEGKDLGGNAYIESNTANNGEVVIALADSRGINGNGAFAAITFEVMGNVGSTSPLTFEKVSANNIDLAGISTTTKGGMFKVTSEAPPEAGDGNVVLAIIAVFTALFLIRKKRKE
jgi:hypothetical protein